MKFWRFTKSGFGSVVADEDDLYDLVIDNAEGRVSRSAAAVFLE